MQLTQKETAYLQDAKSHEQLCITKYTTYSQQVSDPQLAQILQSIGQQEQKHLQSISQLLQGQIPQVGAQSGGQQAQSGMGPQGFTQSGTANQGPMKPGAGGQQANGAMTAGSQYGSTGGSGFDDKTICTDLLTTEKAVSDMYQHAVFEFTNPQARQVLDHIEQEEHQHGFALFQYMQQKGYYQPK